MIGFLFNIDHGYLEGLCRGLKNELLTEEDYSNLIRCQNLEDFKLNLQATEYGDFVSNIDGPVDVAKIETKLKEKLVKEFQYMHSQATGILAVFLDFVTHSYMIDNVMLLIAGTVHKQPISQLLPKCHPLGSFEELKAIHAASTPAELYNAVLLDTPVAPYFRTCINERDLDEMNIEIVRNTVFKAYIEAFYSFCKNVGGDTEDIMCEILRFEADRRAFMITINSLGSELTKEDRERLFPICGNLHPMSLKSLARASSYEEVAYIANSYAVYKECFDNSDDIGVYQCNKTVEENFCDHEVKLNLNCFMRQFHFGVFYSLMKLREQECSNIIWFAECIAQKNKRKIDHYIRIL